MEKLKELKEKIENIEISYNYEETYCNLYNTCIDYMNDTQQGRFDELFDDVVDYDLAEELAGQALKDRGLFGLYCFLGDANCRNDIFKIDGYGNLADLHYEDLKNLKDEILEEIENEIEEMEE